ncbi:MAG: histidine--tRNA ligase [Candidatus Levybacteria bacterium]|nr:histidine--tRNA ligase [Candidatus Levybacteria bacterium]
MKIEPKTLKGFRDFLPKEARKRAYVLETLKKVFESYGFEPLETPVLEYEEILAGKYGDEGDKLMYKFTDNGGRKVAMRYDQTVPLARVVAEYANNLPLPFKRYQIQNVYRAENTQKGRYREFLQVDIDTAGSSSLLSDAEIIAIAVKGYEALGFKNFKVKINDRSIFSNLDKKAVIIIDKLEKIGIDEVKKELEANNISSDLIDEIKNQKPTESINACSQILKNIGINEELIKFDPTLARGLDYYTGLIFEVVSDDYPAGSLGGGGRYDNLIGMFADQTIPAVGFSFGFDRVIEAMDELNLFPQDLGGTKVLVTNTSDRSSAVASQLRNKGFSVELFVEDKPLDKQLKYADKKGIPYVLIVDEQTLTLKNMKTGERKEVTLADLSNAIR